MAQNDATKRFGNSNEEIATRECRGMAMPRKVRPDTPHRRAGRDRNTAGETWRTIEGRIARQPFRSTGTQNEPRISALRVSRPLGVSM